MTVYIWIENWMPFITLEKTNIFHGCILWQWDSSRLKAESLFVMGARANKALGLGQTRGRIYIKHPEVFKVSCEEVDLLSVQS